MQGNVFQNTEKLLSMSCQPLGSRPDTPAVNTSLFESPNNTQAEHADGFTTKHCDTTVLQFDVNTVLNGMLDRCEKDGYKNVTGYCPRYSQPDILANPGKYGCMESYTYFWYTLACTITFCFNVLTNNSMRKTI
jgi:hypothetical protein